MKSVDIVHISKVLADIHSSVVRASVPALRSVNNVLQFDDIADPQGVPAYTVAGGARLSKNEFVILFDKHSQRPKKFHGQTIWLTRRYLVRKNKDPQPKNSRQHFLLHEFCHFVGPSDNRPAYWMTSATSITNGFLFWASWNGCTTLLRWRCSSRTGARGI